MAYHTAQKMNIFHATKWSSLMFINNKDTPYTPM